MKWQHKIFKAMGGSRCLQIIPKRSLALSYKIVHGHGISDKPPLLMIHGLLGNKNNFNTIRRLLQAKLPNMTIITCDVRNHGASPHSNVMNYHVMAEDILELLETLKIDKCTLLGHSLGGRIAMRAALTQGNRVDKLIVVDIAPGIDGRHGIGTDTIQYVEAMKLVKFDQGMTMSEARSNAAAQLAEAIPKKSVRNFILTNLVKMRSGSFDWRVNLNAVLENMTHLGRLRDKEILTPYNGETLFLCGELSGYVTSDDISEIKSWFPNAVIKYLQDSGHWVHADKPELFSDNVATFI